MTIEKDIEEYLCEQVKTLGDEIWFCGATSIGVKVK